MTTPKSIMFKGQKYVLASEGLDIPLIIANLKYRHDSLLAEMRVRLRGMPEELYDKAATGDANPVRVMSSLWKKLEKSAKSEVDFVNAATAYKKYLLSLRSKMIKKQTSKSIRIITINRATHIANECRNVVNYIITHVEHGGEEKSI